MTIRLLDRLAGCAGQLPNNAGRLKPPKLDPEG